MQSIGGRVEIKGSRITMRDAQGVPRVQVGVWDTGFTAKDLADQANAYVDQVIESLTEYEVAAIAATHVVQFEPFGNGSTLTTLPGFGVFQNTTVFDPTDMGDVGRKPASVDVLRPADYYPAMQYAAARALWLVAAAQQLAREEAEVHQSRSKKALGNLFK